MLNQTKCLLSKVAFVACAVTLQTGCQHQSYSSPECYDLIKGEKMELGKVLNEISGINYNTDNKSLLAISDSKENVFELEISRLKLKDYTGKVVGPNSDLEDIVKVGDQLFLLSSKGIIYEVSQKDSSGVKAHPFYTTEGNDFETLYYDPAVTSLVMMCKSCQADKGKGMRSAYRFNLDTRQFDTTAFFSIPTDDVKKLMKDDNAKFDPSAAAIHPVNKRLYILSSAGNLLVIADTHGKVIEGYQLNPDQHPQAEGIAFAPNGDMFISNEGI
jgi:uncharacterized protein YjiK